MRNGTAPAPRDRPECFHHEQHDQMIVWLPPITFGGHERSDQIRSEELGMAQRKLKPSAAQQQHGIAMNRVCVKMKTPPGVGWYGLRILAGDLFRSINDSVGAIACAAKQLSFPSRPNNGPFCRLEHRTPGWRFHFSETPFFKPHTRCIHGHRVQQTRHQPVWLPILHVVSWTGKMNISLSPFAPENLVSPDGFGSPVSRQPAHSPPSG